MRDEEDSIEIKYSDLKRDLRFKSIIKDNCADKFNIKEDKKDLIYYLKIKRKGSNIKFSVNKLRLKSKNVGYEYDKEKINWLKRPLVDIPLLGDGGEIEGSIIYEVPKDFDISKIEFDYSDVNNTKSEYIFHISKK